MKPINFTLLSLEATLGVVIVAAFIGALTATFKASMPWLETSTYIVIEAVCYGALAACVFRCATSD